MYCRLKAAASPSYPDGYNRKTRANGNGSIRYHWHATQDEAIAAALSWARRKVNEHVAECWEYAALEDRVQVARKAEHAKLTSFDPVMSHFTKVSA